MGRSPNWDPSPPVLDIYSGITCPSPTRCLALGDGILASADACATWTDMSLSTAVDLRGITCPSATRCLAVGTRVPSWSG